MRDLAKWVAELIVKTFLDTWIRPLIVGMAIAASELVRKHLVPSAWLLWLSANSWAWAAICIFIVTVSLFLFRKEKTKYPIPYFGFFGGGSPRRRRNVRELPFGDAVWKITTPAHKTPIESLESDEIEAHIPPYCKHCGTELEERQGLFQRYTWHCVGCDATMRGKRSFGVEAQRAVKIARREIRNQKEP